MTLAAAAPLSLAESVSAVDPDWSRERPRAIWDPSRRLIRCVRRYESAKFRPSPLSRLLRWRWVLQHRFWSVITQADIPLSALVGGGLMMPHPNGVVIHPDATLGPNCLIMQQVTIGVDGSRPGVPRVGGHVDFGAGAKVLGPITIGDHAVIGANAVVVRDVPARCVAVGVPARILAPRAPGRKASRAG